MAGYTFIAYAHEDTPFALKLARHLQKQGVGVWLDQWHLNEDENWDRSIANALYGSHYVLIILSRNAINSWLVQQQVVEAVKSEKILLVAMRQPCQTPDVLQNIPCVNFTRPNFRAALSQLLSYYLPRPEIHADYQAQLKYSWQKICNDFAQFWRATLLPLLWPGWLGPTLLLVLAGLVAFAWQRSNNQQPVPQSTPEVLTIVLSTPTPTPSPTPLKTRTRPVDDAIMLEVPAGEFLMGSSDTDPAASADEKPQRQVYIDTFWIDQTEITNGQYQRCVEAGACTRSNVYNKNFEAEALPVVGVNWHQAKAYCRWVGGRLPTEAEWEKAARGADGRLYPWGNQFDGYRLNYCDASCVADWRDQSANDGYRYTAPAGSYPGGASPYGVLDMSGNVWEWTADWYGSDTYAQSATLNPAGPDSGVQRVIRGGSWLYKGASIRVARRHKDTPTSSYDNIGFRCVVAKVEQTY